MKKKLLFSVLSVGVIGAVTFYGTVKFSADASQKVSAPISAQVAEKAIPIIHNTDEEKTNIQTLMLNSIDYFKTVKGSFEYYSTAASFHYLVDYQVDFSENPRSLEKIQNVVPVEKFNIHAASDSLSVQPGYEKLVYDGETISNFSGSSKDHTTSSITISETPKSQPVKVDKVSRKEREQSKRAPMSKRVGKFEDGEKYYISKIDPAYMGMSRTSVLPDTYAMNLLEDKEKWNITRQGEYLERDTVIIEGELSNDYQQRTGGKNFTLEVDRETGILLKLEITDQKGILKDVLITKDIEIDEELDQSLFENVAK